MVQENDAAVLPGAMTAPTIWRVYEDGEEVVVDTVEYAMPWPYTEAEAEAQADREEEVLAQRQAGGRPMVGWAYTDEELARPRAERIAAFRGTVRWRWMRREEFVPSGTAEK